MADDFDDEQQKKKRNRPTTSDHQIAAEEQANSFIEKALKEASQRSAANHQQTEERQRDRLRDELAKQGIDRRVVPHIAVVQPYDLPRQERDRNGETIHGRVRFKDGSSLPIQQTPEEFARAYGFRHLGGADNISANPDLAYRVEVLDLANDRQRNPDFQSEREFQTRLSWADGGKGQSILLLHHHDTVKAVIVRGESVSRGQIQNHPTPARNYGELRNTQRRIDDATVRTQDQHQALRAGKAAMPAPAAEMKPETTLAQRRYELLHRYDVSDAQRPDNIARRQDQQQKDARQQEAMREHSAAIPPKRPQR